MRDSSGDELLADVNALLGHAVSAIQPGGGYAGFTSDLEEASSLLGLALEYVVQEIEQCAADDRTDELPELARLILRLNRTHQEVGAHIQRQRRDALANVQDALTRLRGIGSMSDMLDAAVREACRSGDFDRGLIVSVEDGMLAIEAVHVGGDAASDAAEPWLKATEALTPNLVEAEVVRRRATVIVKDDPTDTRPCAFDAARDEQSYIASCLVSGGHVVGLLEVDRAFSARPLTELDRDAVAAFAIGLGYAFERVALSGRLQAQRDDVRRLVRATETLADELCDAQVSLERADQRVSAGVPLLTTRLLAKPGDDVAEPISTREMDVLREMATGATNAEIAARLYISEQTVKSHVKRILRKLSASNRSEAVVRFLRSESRTQMQV